MTRAALYLRVSTSRQAEKELSIPDQRQQGETYCKNKGWQVVAEFVEPGASATSDKRQAFQEMIESAKRNDKPFDTIVVHSFSRFFRDAFEFELYRRTLEKHQVFLVSITQELGDGPSDGMMRQILNLFDEYQSKETSKHVRRSMLENARQGFWNGGRPPYGYYLEVAEMRGATAKKKLAIETKEAEIVRLIYDLYLNGHNGWTLGVKEIAKYLNAKGYRNRQGNMFAIGKVHGILKDPTTIGLHHYNKKKGRKYQFNDPSEWIEMKVPAIIDAEIYIKHSVSY